MSNSSVIRPDQFEAFFCELYPDKHGNPRAPFPWQKRLAKRACEGNWPKCIALPTAAGKTACIDIAVFALACQASQSAAERTSPRRIFFVVDRRIVVDQAYEHAKQLSAKLRDATNGVIKQVSEALKEIGQSDRPLDYYALRGGMYRESAWVRSPLQPTVITSTVDQVGSRLLFRGYGVSDSLKPIHAGLVGNDSLIVLDEAHCARPFDQTAAAVSRYRGWADQPLSTPFRFVTMTATPSSDTAECDIERDNEDDHNDKKLGPRINASKPALLEIAKKATGKKWRPELVKSLVTHALALEKEGFRAVGVIVNRVATARDTAAALRRDGVDVILLTGRMRPIDREEVVKQIGPLFSGSSEELPKSTFVVATQCLEVGADLDFHALVTECASLDSLRQRFGRLNRVAARPEAKGVVVVRGDQIQPMDDPSRQDFVYGNSLAKTWIWLKDNANGDSFDFGVAAISAKTKKMTSGEVAELNSPTTDAAVLLPAHLDLWCQTNPIPMPDPDPSVFLHGPSSGVPDVQVVFRADLGGDDTEWSEIVSLCPPSSSEALPVRFDEFKRWLAYDDKVDESSDIEGETTVDVEERSDPELTKRKALRWRGTNSRETKVISSPRSVRPGDLFVIQISNDASLSGLGDFPGGMPTDLGDEAFQVSRDRAILRLTPSILNLPAICEATLEDEDSGDTLSTAIKSLVDDPRKWVNRAASSLLKPAGRAVTQHPLGGFVITGRERLNQFDPSFCEADESYESVSDKPVALTDHCGHVAMYARLYAVGAGLTQDETSALELAGHLHDAGKADPRFQAMLHKGNRRRADLFPHRLAKSIAPMPSRNEREIARRLAGYPKGGRHELLSLRLAESDGILPDERTIRDLILHLIASHHGYCRPFAPVVEDLNPEYVSFNHTDRELHASSDTHLERLDSGVAERFWKLTRHFGWWGLPWLESILRLADWAASDVVAQKGKLHE